MTHAAQLAAVQDLGAATEWEEWVTRLVSTPTADGSRRSVRDIAKALGKSESTIHRAVARCRKHVLDDLLDLPGAIATKAAVPSVAAYA